MFRLMLLGAVLAQVLFVTSISAHDDDAIENGRISAQKICPVSGKALGSMGAPIRVRAGDQDVYLCCRGCLRKQITQKHWSQVLANLAAAQKECPVMKRKLPADAKMTVLNRRIVFVCCEPCIRKMQSDPKRYLDFVDHQYVSDHDH